MAPSLDELRPPLEVLEPARDVSDTGRPLRVGAAPDGLLAWPLVLVLQAEDAVQGSETTVELALLVVLMLHRL